MIKAIKQKTIVGKQGKIEVQSPELLEGTEVEIIILIPSAQTDTTEYILSTEANGRELLSAIERVEKQENLVSLSLEEWHEKYSL